MICIIERPSLALQACTPIFAEAQFAFFALIFLRDSTAMARSPEPARLFQQPDLENHWEPMRNRALPSGWSKVKKGLSDGQTKKEHRS